MPKPIRKIVVTRSHEFLYESWSKKSFAAGGGQIERAMQSRGMTLNDRFHAVKLNASVTNLELANAVSPNRSYKSSSHGSQPSFCIDAEFEDEDAVARFVHDKSDENVAVFSNPTIHAFPSYCGGVAVGSHYDVAREVGVQALRGKGLTGRGVKIAIVDTGIDGSKVPVKGGWSPDPNYRPGTHKSDHGTMCAFDAAISAPDADIYDFALLQSAAIGFTDFLLSDAILAYDELRNLMQSTPGPLVISNSWGMYDRADDEPVGSSGNYSANPLHPFNLIVGDLVEAGADIFFAAGNCGGNCPDYRCGHGDVGPGSSIHGANSHPDVITIAAVTVSHVRLGYSSQGPGGLTKSKPDLAGYSHFKGSGVYEADSGTSAACPVAAGVAAAIRQGFGLSSLEPAQLKAVLQRTAKDVGKQGWDYDHGFGVINAAAAISHLTGS